MTINIVPLGAGRDVGRSCILLYINDRVIMLDCGMHMGFNDARRFPNFDSILSYDRYGYKRAHPQPKVASNTFTPHIDAVLISHYHLDHCGALPFFTERMGYSGPVYMSAPTRTICPRLIDDFRKISIEDMDVEAVGEDSASTTSAHTKDPCFFSHDDIDRCMAKTKVMALGEEQEVCPGVFVTAYYAGHVVGAVMFYVRSGSESVLYTGDYNMTADQHLGAACMPHLKPDVLITEGTYAATVRDSRPFREHTFLAQVQAAIDRGGKVLIPVFALGRAQELCLLLDAHWRRHGLYGKVPIYLSAGMALVSNQYYRLHAGWCHAGIKQRLAHGALDCDPAHLLHTAGLEAPGSEALWNDEQDHGNAFSLPSVQPLPRDAAYSADPLVALSTPGMLHAGTSLGLFKEWSADPRNLVVIPGFCVPGTVGSEVLNGAKSVMIKGDRGAPPESCPVNLEVSLLSFSAHADAHGIATLVRQSGARHIVLVHGEGPKLDTLALRLRAEVGVECSVPANGVGVSICGGVAVAAGWQSKAGYGADERRDAQVRAVDEVKGLTYAAKVADEAAAGNAGTDTTASDSENANKMDDSVAESEASALASTPLADYEDIAFLGQLGTAVSQGQMLSRVLGSTHLPPDSVVVQAHPDVLEACETVNEINTCHSGNVREFLLLHGVTHADTMAKCGSTQGIAAPHMLVPPSAFEAVLGASSISMNVSTEVQVSVSASDVLSRVTYAEAELIRAMARGEAVQGSTRGSLIAALGSCVCASLECRVESSGTVDSKRKYEEELRVVGTSIRVSTVRLGEAVSSGKGPVQVRIEWAYEDDLAGCQVETVIKTEVAAMNLLHQQANK